MRIALVSPYALDVPGGVQSHIVALARELRSGGDAVWTVSPGPPGPEHRGVGGTVQVPFNDSVAPIGLTPGAARRTLRVLAELEPDLVHVHEPIVPWVSLAATSRAPGPLVATFHAWSDRDRVYRLAAPVARRVVGRAGAWIGVSAAAATYHARALGLPEGRFRVIPNGVEVGRFAAAEPFPEISDNPHPYLLFVGRLERRKGLEQLLRAFVILKATRPDVRLLVVGEGPERDRCQAMLPARLRSDVVFLGRVEQQDLPRFYRSCDVFVSPALGGESFGIVIVEAMAAGCPVVASDIPGFRGVIHDGVDGRLVPAEDPRALARALQTLLENPALLDAMAAEAARTVVQYDWPEVARRIRAVYDDVLDTSRVDRRGARDG